MASRAQEIDVKLLLFAIQRTTTFENLLAQKFIHDIYEVRNQIWFPASCTLMAIWFNNLPFWDNSWVPEVSSGIPTLANQPLGSNALCTSGYIHISSSLSSSAAAQCYHRHCPHHHHHLNCLCSIQYIFMFFRARKKWCMACTPFFTWPKPYLLWNPMLLFAYAGDIFVIIIIIIVAVKFFSNRIMKTQKRRLIRFVMCF